MQSAIQLKAVELSVFGFRVGSVEWAWLGFGQFMQKRMKRGGWLIPGDIAQAKYLPGT